MVGDDKLEVLSEFHYLSGMFFAWSGCKLAAVTGASVQVCMGQVCPMTLLFPPSTICLCWPKDKCTQHV